MAEDADCLTKESIQLIKYKTIAVRLINVVFENIEGNKLDNTHSVVSIDANKYSSSRVINLNISFENCTFKNNSNIASMISIKNIENINQTNISIYQTHFENNFANFRQFGGIEMINGIIIHDMKKLDNHTNCR